MCFCNPSFDVRCTCWVHDKDWKRCPQRWATAYWRINNHPDFNDNWAYCKQQKQQIMKTCKFKQSDWQVLMDMRKEDEDYEIEGLDQQIEQQLQELEETLFKCEMTVDRTRALNKIAPDNLPKDLYDIIYKQIVII
jgi:hypothetical protein